MKKILLISLTFLFALSSQADLLAVEHEHNWKKGMTFNYAASLKSAKVEQKKVKKVGMEWNTIRKLMKSAAKKHKAGNDKVAVKLLKVAKEHAILGQQQARDQANAGPNF